MATMLARGVTILVVEDDAGVAESIREVLVRAGYKVPQAAPSAARGLELAASASPTLVLMDVGLEGSVDGIETARQMRHVAPEARIVYITGASDDATLQRARATGPVGYLRKPFTPPELRIAVEIALHQAGLEKEIAERERKAGITERLTAIGTMAAGLQHEINNPLASVVANVEFVRDALRAQHEAGGGGAGTTSELLAALDDASEGAQRVRRTMEELRLFSHSDEASEGEVDLSAALDEAVRLTATQVRHLATVRRAYGQVPRIVASSTRLVRAFINLLLHAANRLGGEGPGKHVITLTTSTGPRGEALVEIHDDGPELSSDVARRLFDPLLMVRSSDPAASLGLAVSHSVVTALGGQMEVRSAPGAGTTLRITLPAASALALAPAPAPPPAPSSVPPSALRTKLSAQPLIPTEPLAQTPTQAPSPVRILVVDDEVTIGKALRRVLGREHEVVAVDEAREALALLAEETFDVIFCDLMMPGMTGMEFRAEIATRWPDLLPRLVFMTGGAVSSTAREFVRNTDHPVVAKPFSRDTLLAAVLRTGAGRE